MDDTSEILSIRDLKELAGANPGKYQVRAQVAASIAKKARNGNPFQEVRLADAEEQLRLMAWEDSSVYGDATKLKSGDFIAVGAEWSVSEKFGLEARDWGFRPLEEDEKAELLNGPEALQQKQAADWKLIEETTAAIADPRLKTLCLAFLEKFGERFRRTGAARKNHHARRGGLVEHVAQMTRSALALCSVYEEMNRDLIVAGVLFHDCGKLWENCYDKEGFTMPYNAKAELISHIPMGIEIANHLWRELSTSPEAAAWQSLDPPSEDVRVHLIHLIASHHGEYEFGAPVLPKTPEAMLLHHIDNIDAKIEMFREGYQSGTLIDPKAGVYDRFFPLPGNKVLPLPTHEP